MYAGSRGWWLTLLFGVGTVGASGFERAVRAEMETRLALGLEALAVGVLPRRADRGSDARGRERALSFEPVREEAFDGRLPLVLRPLAVLSLVPAASDQTPVGSTHLVEHPQVIVGGHSLIVPPVDDEHRATHPRRVDARGEGPEVRDEAIPLQVLGPAPRLILESRTHHAASHRLREEPCRERTVRDGEGAVVDEDVFRHDAARVGEGSCHEAVPAALRAPRNSDAIGADRKPLAERDEDLLQIEDLARTEVEREAFAPALTAHAVAERDASASRVFAGALECAGLASVFAVPVHEQHARPPSRRRRSVRQADARVEADAIAHRDPDGVLTHRAAPRRSGSTTPHDRPRGARGRQWPCRPAVLGRLRRSSRG